MDLGRARLRKVGINNLHCAVHPRHGVIWTDGKGIYLAPIQVEGHLVQNAASVKLGEFENVTSVHWSNITDVDSCHMCVVHQQNVTVWRVSGALPKLSFKQVRKINVRPVPQGCLWNPTNDVLCLLSRHQCSFYFRHDQNKGSYAIPPLESGSIACGCWSTDGTKLVLCVGAALLIYRWSDVNAKIDDFAATAWRIPSLEGKLTSIAPVLKDSVVVAAEIPLESLCKQQDMFKVPDALGDGQSNSHGVIRPHKSASVTESLLNLQQNTQAVTDCRSSLTLIHLQDGSRDPVKLSTVPLKGAVTPDILMYEKNSQSVVVGSNSQSHLHIFALLEKHLAYCGNIQLDKGQRPKGLCSMPTIFDDRGAALLILVGQREVEESGLTSPSIESEFKLSLKYIILKAGCNHLSKHSGRSDSIKERSSSHTKSSSLIKSEKLTAHHVKNLSDPSVHKWNDDGKQSQQASQTGPTKDEIKLPVSSTEVFPSESELLMKPPVDEKFHKGELIKDLSGDPSHPENLEVDMVSFSSQVPSFCNSKFTATYELSPVENELQNDQTDALQHSLPKDPKRRETVDENASDTSAIDLYPQPDQISQKADNSDLYSSVREEVTSGDTNANNSHYQTHDNYERSISLKDASSVLQTENFSSLQLEVKPQTTYMTSQTEIDSSNLQLDTKSQMTSDSSPSERGSKGNISSLDDNRYQMTSISSQPERGSSDHFSSSQFEIRPQNTPNFSQTEHELLVSGLQSDIKPQATCNISQVERDSQDHFSSLQSKILPRTTSSSLWTDGKSPDNFYSLQSDAKPEPTITSLQTVRDSPKHFSSLQSGLLSNSNEGRIELLEHSPRTYEVDRAKEETLSDHGLESSQHSMDSIWDALEKQANSQKDNISALYKRLEMLSTAVDKTTCVFPTKYQDMSMPEMVEIYCEKPEGTETKRFLLDSGRLQLEPIKLAFDLATVELWLDGFPCVLGANIDGYIPLKFSPSTKLHISGRPKDRSSSFS